jgi:hypothetical protein
VPKGVDQIEISDVVDELAVRGVEPAHIGGVSQG